MLLHCCLQPSQLIILKNSGPSHQKIEAARSFAHIPCDNKSAGLSLVGTWHHCWGDDFIWISPGLKATKDLNFLLRFFTQREHQFWLIVENVTLLNGISSALDAQWPRCSSLIAAINSYLGIEIVCNGVTQLLLLMSHTEIPPSLYTHLRYDTAP